MFNFLKNREESDKKATQKNTQTKSNSVQKENSQGGSVGSSLKKWVNSSEEIADKDIKNKNKAQKTSGASNSDPKIREHKHSHGRGL